MSANKNKFSSEKSSELLNLLNVRFEENQRRHKEINWEEVKKRLQASPEKLGSLQKMEETGGEPDVVGIDEKTGEFIFFDCSKESPKGRRSLCYDRDALESRKKFKPENSAVDLAHEMGIELLSEEEYIELQKLGTFDTKTSSWLKTPSDIRLLGGAIFGDFRFGRTFIYHNGAESYYAARGFRGSLRV